MTRAVGIRIFSAQLFIAARQSSRLSRIDIAHATGIRSDLLTLFETGTRFPSRQTLDTIAETTGIDILDMLGPLPQTCGSALAAVREVAGFNQEQMTERTSISLRTIQRLERGRYNPSQRHIEQWINAVQIDDIAHQLCVDLAEICSQQP